MDQAKQQLLYLGDAGEPYIERLKAIRGTFAPDDIDPSFFRRIEDVATDLAGLAEVDMRPVAKFEKIEPLAPNILPEATLAIQHLNAAVNWLRGHAE
jgi:hypothetical protein